MPMIVRPDITRDVQIADYARRGWQSWQATFRLYLLPETSTVYAWRPRASVRSPRLPL